MNRGLKQLLIGIIFILILGLIGYGIFEIFDKEPNCFDGLKNGKEEGIDCGAIAGCKVCDPEIKPLNVDLQKVIKIGENDRDFIATITNPNSIYGSSKINYDIINSVSGATLLSGQTYIIPGQTKYIIQQAIKDKDITGIGLRIKSVEWLKTDGSDKLVNLLTRKSDFQIINSGSVYSQLEGSIFNNSNYDLDRVDVAVVIFDESNNIVGVAKTNIRTFPAEQERYFKVTWPNKFEAEYFRAEVEATTDLFNNYNFLKSHGTEEKFQKYY